MKYLVMFIISFFSFSCTDAERAKYGALGHPAHIQCYSGGSLIYDGLSTGTVKFLGWNNRYISFKDKTDGMLKQISGNCVIAYLDETSTGSIQDSGASNFRVDFDSDFEIYDPIAKLAGRCIMEKFTIESLAKAVAKNVEEGGYNIPTTQEVLEEVNKTPLCIDYCQGLVQTLNESPNSSVVEKWGILEICASVGVILPEDRIKWDTEVTLKRKIPVEF